MYLATQDYVKKYLQGGNEDAKIWLAPSIQGAFMLSWCLELKPILPLLPCSP